MTLFMVLTNTDFWEDPPRARHQVTEALMKNYSVFFVSTNRVGMHRIKIQDVDERLKVLIPYYPIDYRIRYRIGYFNKMYQNWLFGILKQTLKNKKVVVINFDNTATEIFKYFENVVFFCNDFNIRYYYLGAIKRYFEECEAYIATNSKLCVATSKFLSDRLLQYNSNTVELRHGAPLVASNPSFRRNGTVRIGLVGFVHQRRFCQETLTELISKSNVEVYIYGTVTNRLRRLFGKYKNVRIRGVLKGKALIDELMKIDVGIAPYRIEDVNLGATPNKLWLYLSVGKPVVVSDIPAIRDWKFKEKFVYRAKNNYEFTNKVFEAYKEDNEELMISRFLFAKENSWDKRIEQLLAKIEELTCIERS